MSRYTTDEPSQSLCNAIAAHPLGGAQSLSSIDFQALCRDLKGAFPDLVRSGFKGTIQSGEPALPYNRAKIDPIAPEPSPVDFDWRFDGSTAGRLAQTLMSGSRGDILCVGTPTVCEVVNNRGGHAFLIDRNPLIAQALGVGTYLTTDLSIDQDLQKLVDLQFDTALVDPPWYTEAYHLWMRRTLPLMRSKASVFVVLFRAFTRASAQSERDKLLECFGRIGHVSLLGYEAVYSTPPFEAEVLSRLGLPVMPSWRAADVLQIKLYSEPDFNVFQSTDWPLSEWERFPLEDQVVAIRRIPTDRGSISFADEASFELRSVSNRDPQRDHYTVWTSRNKAAVVAGTRRLAAILSRSTDRVVDASDLAVAARLSQRLGFKLRRHQ